MALRPPAILQKRSQRPEQRVQPMARLGTFALARQTVVGHVLSMIDKGGFKFLRATLSTLSTVSLPPLATGPLIQLAR
jgi:hypothetical protein